MPDPIPPLQPFIAAPLPTDRRMTLGEAFGHIESIASVAMFEQRVLGANTGRVVVEFFDPGCPHCQRMAPIVATMADRLEGQVKVFKADVWGQAALRSRYDVTGWPTFILFENGRMLGRSVGEDPSIERLIRRAYRV
jgi:thioredoxin 1